MFFRKPEQRRLYLDYAAATPLLPEVKAAMRETEDFFGNPSAIHAEGQKARGLVEGARAKLARTLGIRSSEIIFTGSGTEANNLAILGYIKALKVAWSSATPPEIISTPIEHPSVENVLKVLEQDGVIVHRIGVNEEGLVRAEDIAALFNKNTALVTLAYANSEVGAVQPIGKIARLVRKYNAANDTNIKTHIDAAQAPLWLPCQLHALGVDMMSLDAGKCNGPKGVGVLAKLSGVTLVPIFYGGGQENDLRPATENVSAIVGAALAIEVAQKAREERVVRVEKLSAALRAALAQLPDIIFNGPAAGASRLPHNVHISLPSLDTEYAVVWLDSKGIAASTKSACGGAGSGQSEVVFQMTGDVGRATATIRFTIDPALHERDMERVAIALESFIQTQDIA